MGPEGYLGNKLYLLCGIKQTAIEYTSEINAANDIIKEFDDMYMEKSIYY